MSEKFHVRVSPSPLDTLSTGKYGIVDWHEDCIGCHDCVKKKSCIYDNDIQERNYLRGTPAPDYWYRCKSCLRCVQECNHGLLSLAVNPDYLMLGDQTYQPEILDALWRQAETGAIPVSGAGYRGPFSGSGFDSMWTDMSEIVRPTRDGIHGREYISAAVELGKRLDFLSFGQDGSLACETHQRKKISFPVIFDLGSTCPPLTDNLIKAAMDAAGALGTLFLGTTGPTALEEIAFPDYRKDNIDPGKLVAVRVENITDPENIVVELAGKGCGLIHLRAGLDGYYQNGKDRIHLKTIIQNVHAALLKNRLRDQVTVMAGGGIALAEHMAKAMLCGADLVSVDQALLIAAGCRLCRRCLKGLPCPAQVDKVSRAQGEQRLLNLMAAWYNQLIEIMGAMGIRDARRLRGESGRAIFNENEIQRFRQLALGRFELNSPILSFEAPAVHPTPSRYKNPIGPYRVVRGHTCENCGLCAKLCPFGVHKRPAGYAKVLRPRDHLCRGQACKDKDYYCVSRCPKQALKVGINTTYTNLGDYRWTPNLILANWESAETGKPAERVTETEFGASDGGFDRLRLRFQDTAPLPEKQLNLAVSLNRSGDNRPKIVIPVPFYGGGMSFGSVGLQVMLARMEAARRWGTFCCTGEGGYPDAIKPYDNHVITQVATGLFGVREETIQRVRIVEFKYAQGAKPGLGGHLLGDKNTPDVALMREAVQGRALFSPFPFHSVYSIEDHKKHIDWIKIINPHALVSVKVSTPTDVDMVAVGSYFAGAHIIHIDGSYGGTGAAPDIAKKNIAMPLEYAIPKVHHFLVEEGIRDKITLIASGGIRNAFDIAKAIALGADGVVTGTAELIALECLRCGNCESGRGCARGIATTDPELCKQFDFQWGAQRISNLYHQWYADLTRILEQLSLASISELVGRTDLLEYLEHNPVCTKETWS